MTTSPGIEDAPRASPPRPPTPSRYAQRLPARGDIGIFNRSHYEEVLVVRVHPENLDRQKLPDQAGKGDVWRRRYREINNWERYLSEDGFRMVNLLLNLSQEEQRAARCSSCWAPNATSRPP